MRVKYVDTTYKISTQKRVDHLLYWKNLSILNWTAWVFSVSTGWWFDTKMLLGEKGINHYKLSKGKWDEEDKMERWSVKND